MSLPTSPLEARPPARRRWVPGLRPPGEGIVPAALVLLGAGLIVALYARDGVRSYAVEARTHGLVLEVLETGSAAWRLEDVTVCARLERRRPGAAASDGAPCDARLFETGSEAVAEIAWPAGTRLALVRGSQGSSLEIGIEAIERPLGIGPLTLRPGSRLLVSAESWQESGALVFSGRARLGSVPASGSRESLIEGRYQITEDLTLSPRPVVVTAGSFFRGDAVRFIDGPDGGPAPVRGVIAPAEAEDSGFAVTITAASARGVMTVDRFGAETRPIRPSWVDRSLSDPALLAATGLLTILTIALSILRGGR